MKQLGNLWKKREQIEIICLYAVNALILLGLILFVLLKPDNLMHSDTTAEVILSRLLADQNKLITTDWFYSTEIRIIYSQLIMAPLFKVFSSYRLVKTISIFIFYILLTLSYRFFAKEYGVSKKWMLLGMIFLFTPLSNEYLDMMFIGCFYTSQVICTYCILAVFSKERKSKKSYLIACILLILSSFVLGLTGLRYLASLFLPLAAAVFIMLFEIERIYLKNAVLTVAMLFSAGIGFLVNKFYLAVHYSFDTTSQVAFVGIEELPERFLRSLRLMIEFFGYYPVEAVSGRGIVNAIKSLFFIAFVGIIIYLIKNRKTLLSEKQRLLLYYFLALFLLNWYMLVFTNVLMQYRYHLPVYVIGILLIAIFFQVYEPKGILVQWKKAIWFFAACVIGLSSLYGELWQDAKYNDCEKRYDYLEFLEDNEYTFGYATFWNASVTEYLSNGVIKVGNLGGEDGVASPYEWLTEKAYYKKGYHEGKTFLLLARTEEAGMLKGDFTVMPDGRKVYEDEYYAIYEGNGMYLFSEE